MTTTDQPPSGVFRTRWSRELAARLDAAGVAVHHVDLRDVTNKGALLRAFAAALSFPPTFGENWDAFYDCLTDLEWLDDAPARIVVVEHAASIAAGGDWQDALAVLRAAADDWAEDGIAFAVLVDGDAGTDRLERWPPPSH